MPKRHALPEELRDVAKEQRRAMTKAEALFWSQVRAERFHGFKFKRRFRPDRTSRTSPAPRLA